MTSMYAKLLSAAGTAPLRARRLPVLASVDAENHGDHAEVVEDQPQVEQVRADIETD
jgi:hypothetical protein